jgi:NAD(P)-dependent dehydrogenase (short-subunit alcohol dehydrogenase family)
MNKALIIGGTQTFGKEIALAFKEKGFEVQTIGRTDPDFAVDAHHTFDLINKEKRKKFFESLLSNHAYSDIVCVVGYARSQKESDINYSRELNVEYVREIFEICRRTQSVKNIITIGSQWSFKSGFAALEDYINAKHELKNMSVEYAQNSLARVNHYCVPTMRTNQLEEVISSFNRTGVALKASGDVVQEPSDIAHTLLQFDQTNLPNGNVYFIPCANVVKQVIDDQFC